MLRELEGNIELIHIDLFSGIGGFALAAQWAGFKTVAFVEIDPYAQELIKQNFGAVADTEYDGWERSSERQNTKRALRATGEIESEKSEVRRTTEAANSCHTRIFTDIFQFNGTAYRGATLLTGGFPCQPFSQAGKRRGKEDDRYLWPEMLRVIHEVRPAWVLGENVAGIVTMELDRVLSDLEGEGYAVQSLIIPACAVDAKHRRDRVWIVGHAGEQSKGRKTRQWASERQKFAGKSEDEISRGKQQTRWESEPNVGRMAHGIPFRVDRIKGLGNAIIPQVAHEIIKIIADIEQGAPHDQI